MVSQAHAASAYRANKVVRLAILDPGLRRDDGVFPTYTVIPAKAGIQNLEPYEVIPAKKVGLRERNGPNLRRE